MRLLKTVIMTITVAMLIVYIHLLAPAAHAQGLNPMDENNSLWLSQSAYPTVEPGEFFSISITFENTGITTWTDAGGYQLVCDTYFHRNNDCMQGQAVGLNGQSIAPGQSATFSIYYLIAPHQPGVYNTWWSIAQNGSIFGNNNVFIQVTVVPYSAKDNPYAGHVLKITQQAYILDVNGDPITARCNGPSDNPNGGGDASLPPNWDVVGMPIMAGFSTAEYSRQEGNNIATYILVAYPDPCNAYDFSSNQDIASGKGAVGFVSEAALSDVQTVTPDTKRSSWAWRHCWDPTTCSTASYPKSTDVLHSNDGNVLYAWWDGSEWDSHWWHVKDLSGKESAVYGRDWIAS